MIKGLFQDAAYYSEASENGEGFPPASGPSLLASSLAWAARNKIPFHKVIPTMTDYGAPGFAYIGGKAWNAGLWHVYADLLAGQPLAQALRKRLRYHLPKYFIQAVEQSEKDGTLERTLPHFSRGLNFSAELRQRCFLTILLPLAELFLIALFICFLSVFIIPKFNKIFMELLEGSRLPFATKLSMHMGDAIGFCISWLPVFLLAFLVGSIVFRGFGWSFLALLEGILLRLPFFRRLAMDKALVELCASMNSYLCAGRNINEALDYSAASCCHPWLRAKLKDCQAKVERGMNWLDAWQEMRLDMPLDEMLLRNAAAKENIAEGFGFVMDWHYRKALRYSKHFALILFLALLAFNAGIVVILALGYFGAIYKIIALLAA